MKRMIFSVCVLLVFYMAYTNDWQFRERVNQLAQIGGYAVIVLLVVGLVYGFCAYLLPAIDDHQDRVSSRKLRESRFAPSANGLYELPVAWMRDERTVQALLMAAVQAQVENPQTLVNPISTVSTVIPVDPPALPPVTDLADLSFRPSTERILLGLDEHATLITVPVTQLCHVALCGMTGGGKSNLLRLIVPQLQAVGAKVCLMDPHYTDMDIESDSGDWRPIRQRLYMPPAVKPSDIDNLLDYMTNELDQRLERRARGEKVGSPLFLAFDELPVIVESVRNVSDRLSRILREGRKVRLYTIGASQDFLVKTIGGSSAVRDCYRTACYVGGDTISASKLLDMPQRTIDDGVLTMGVSYLRSAATTPAQLVRVPFASNEAVYQLLDSAEGNQVLDFQVSDKTGIWQTTGRQPADNVSDKNSAPQSQELSYQEIWILRLFFDEHRHISEIVETVFGVTSKGGGRKYTERREEVERVIQGRRQV